MVVQCNGSWSQHECGTRYPDPSSDSNWIYEDNVGMGQEVRNQSFNNLHVHCGTDLELNLKIKLGLVLWHNAVSPCLREIPAFFVDASSSSNCSTWMQLPANMSEKAAENGSSTQTPTTHMGDLSELSGFNQANSWLLWLFGGMNQRIVDLSTPFLAEVSLTSNRKSIHF